MDYKSVLNKDQLLAVEDTEGAILVLAGAGSGKTRVLTYRIANLLDKGVSPYNILAITFTNKATKEMYERIDSVCPNGHKVWVSTFHSMCCRILRFDIDKLGYTGNFTIYSDYESENVIKNIIKEIPDIEEKLEKSASYHISKIKNDDLDVNKYCLDNNIEYADNLIAIYNKYIDRLKRNNALDYDDLILKTIELFEKFPDVLEKYQERFHYIHVDEFQDTNFIQFKIVKMLSNKYGNLFAVGDEDQSIYGWRGASIRNILDFKKVFPSAKIYKLEENYRSTQVILDAANNLISKNKMRIGKNLFTEKKQGVNIEMQYLERDRDEAEYVANKIYYLVKNEDVKYKDIAVLTRVNSLSRTFEEKFKNYNIPYIVFGGLKFYDRKEIKDIVAYLLLICNPKDNESFKRIINLPKRGIGETSVNTLSKIADDFNKSLLEAIDLLTYDSGIARSTVEKLREFKKLIGNLISLSNTLNLSDFIVQFMKSVNFNEIYSKDSDEDEARRLNIGEFVNSVLSYTEENKTEEENEIKLSDYLQSLSLMSDIDSDDDKDNSVRIATIHAVKGLEFRVVFIVGLEDGTFPLKRAMDNDMEMEEERRIAYVAITRAKERLYLTYTGSRFKFNRFEYNTKSRFLDEISKSIPEKAANVNRPSEVNKQIHYEQYTGNKFIIDNTSNNMNKSINSTRFQTGEKVVHIKFGIGIIKEISGNNATIDFNELGIKTLNMNIAPIKKYTDSIK